MLLERKRREDAERRRQREEMERILEENRRRVGAGCGASAAARPAWGAAVAWARRGVARHCMSEAGTMQRRSTMPLGEKTGVLAPSHAQVEEAQRKAAEAAAEQQGLGKPAAAPARRRQGIILVDD